MQVWRRAPAPTQEREADRPSVAISAAARAALADELKAALDNLDTALPSEATAAADAINQAFEDASNDPLVGLLKTLIEGLTGQAIRLFSSNDLRRVPDAAVPQPPRHAGPPPHTPTPAPETPAPEGGFDYLYHSVREEYQRLDFSASGTVRTSDGQEIRFTLDLSLSRYYREETSVQIQSGNAPRRDPLVLNFDGTAAQLSNRQFLFDLLGDGRKTSVPMLEGNRAYLAFDRNGNGKIDSGRELFGPASNAGFGELAALDSDGNGWIDAGDAAFDRLALWRPQAGGAGSLQNLAQGKVGAIGLQHAASPFELRGQGNRDLGAIAATGIYLDAAGRPGTVQEVDLTA